MHSLWRRKNGWGTRLAGLLVTALLLGFIFRQVDLHALATSLRRLNPVWFGFGFAAYGAALALGGVRSHFALRLTDRAVHLGASCRSFLVGHFFFVTLFGAVGGDLAKSAVYGRWYRFALPELLAAASLDRILGLAGTTLLAALVVPVTLFNHGFTNWRPIEFRFPPWWGAAVVALIATLLIRLGWQKWGASWASAWQAFRAGVRGLFSSPSLSGPGLLSALVAQTVLSAVFAFNLQAITYAQAGPLPWGRMLWTFPAITVLSCLPFTAAGAGARELAAMTFLGLYGVSAGDAVSASLITLVQKVAWGFFGALALGREETRLGRMGEKPATETISVIIPTLNEAENLAETLRRARSIPEVKEIIVVDGGSQDGTVQVAAQWGCRVLTSPPGRGRQMRLGAIHASGEVVLLLHADTWLPAGAGRALFHCLRDRTVVGGGFWKTFRNGSWLLLGSRWKCAVRLFVGRRIAGDQALFIRRPILEGIGGVPDMQLMEEFELCRRLRQVGRLALADATLLTSARRFEKLGVCRTYLRMWYVTTLYRLGIPDRKLSRLYNKE